MELCDWVCDKRGGFCRRALQCSQVHTAAAQSAPSPSEYESFVSQREAVGFRRNCHIYIPIFFTETHIAKLIKDSLSRGKARSYRKLVRRCLLLTATLKRGCVIPMAVVTTVTSHVALFTVVSLSYDADRTPPRPDCLSVCPSAVTLTTTQV